VKSAPGGFSLLELLVAMNILVVVACGLVGALHAGLIVWDRLEKETEGRQQAQALFARMARELRNAVPFPDESLVGNEREIRFMAARRIFDENNFQSRDQGMFAVAYRCEEKGMGSVLRRVETPLGETAGAFGWEPKVSDIPAEVRFEYPYAPANKGDAPVWKDRWTRPGELPAGLRLRLTLFDNAGRQEKHERVITLPVDELPAWRE